MERQTKRLGNSGGFLSGYLFPLIDGLPGHPECRRNFRASPMTGQKLLKMWVSGHTSPY
jgi:hypothetical protein